MLEPQHCFVSFRGVYMLVATEDNTDVEVHYAENGDVTLPDEYFTLNKYEVFTRSTYYVTDQPEIDFTGSRVLTDKPVAVYSGGQVYIHAPVSYSLLPCGSFFFLLVLVPPASSNSSVLNNALNCALIFNFSPI